MNLLKTLSMIPAILLAIPNAPASAQSIPVRPPAIPLITCDPYFSIWSTADSLTGDWTKHWTGSTMGMTGMIMIDGKAFRVMGRSPRSAPALTQTGVTVLPTRTIYDFEEAGIHLTLSFMTPLLPGDLDLLSRPAAFITWKVRSIDGTEHAVSVYFDTSAEPAVNTSDQPVTWGRYNLPGLDVVRIGSEHQPILEKSGDDLRIDWGFLYLASRRGPDDRSVVSDDESARGSFAASGTLPASDDLRCPRRADDHWPVMAQVHAFGKVGKDARTHVLVLAYDDLYSIQYLLRNLRPYWRRDGAGPDSLLHSAFDRYDMLVARCEKFDDELVGQCTSAGGAAYVLIASLAYRQCLAANKLCADIDGTPLMFPKENFSNGCIGTVDVIYPASPFFLLFNPELLKAQLRPVLDYAKLPRWKFPFAPHDLGTYPLANGQVYGGGEQTEENQMPVEESGNMLLMTAGVALLEGHPDFALQYWPLLSRWAGYLREKGLDPENQLCTDDFAGHLAHNVNLSLKAILALDAYARLCDMSGKPEEALTYHRIAREFAAKWKSMADDGDHYRLAFDRPGTWSQKYNLVWDRILGLNLFPEDVGRKEIAYYLGKQKTYGLPLDNRKDYTKLDWTVWSASLASNRKDFEALISPLAGFINRTPDRVPLTDWFWTTDARQCAFQARSVVGGVFVKLLMDPSARKRWHERPE